MLRKIVRSHLCSYSQKRIKEIRETYSHPIALQEKALFFILDRARSTEFGRKYDFESIKSIATYQKRTPLVKYDDIKDWIEKSAEGRPNVLWPGRIRDFALTSGTTSGSKHIPISRELLATDRRAALDCLTFYLAESGDGSLLDGRFLFLGGSTALRRIEKHSFGGDLSGIASWHNPFIFDFMFEPDRKTAFISDWDEKITKIAQKAVGLDIRGISGIPSWLLIFFNRVIEEASKRRGEEVKTISDVWPNLFLLIHGGVNFVPYKDIFDRVIGKEVYYLETYSASEAFVAIQDKKNERGLLLMLDYDIFYEFISESEVGKDNPVRLTVADVELDKNYAIVLTNNSGLYSYILGDTVKFVDLEPLRLVVTGRIENFLSAFGEHLIVEEAEDAINYACEETGAEIEDFTVAPYFPQNPEELPCHEWLVEFIKEPKDLNKFAEYLDSRLRQRNEDYHAHRGRDVSIGKPRIIALRNKAFYDWMKSTGQLGGQHKVPRLRNDRKIADSLLQLANRKDLS